MLSANEKSEYINFLANKLPENDIFRSNEVSIINPIIPMNIKRKEYKDSHLLYKSPISPYNNVYTFGIDRKNLLSSIQLKFTLTTASVSFQPFTASLLCKNIFLEKIKGNEIIQEINPDYTRSRINSSTYNYHTYLSDQMTVDTTDNTCFLTCFFYFSEDPSLFINTDMTEPLQIRIILNDDYTNMGLSDELTDIQIKMISTYFELSNKVLCPKRFLSFNQVTKTYPISNGQNSFVIDELDIDKTVYNMWLDVRRPNGNIKRVKSFLLKTNNYELINYDFRQSSYIYEPNGIDYASSGLLYWFSTLRNRKDETGSLNLVDLKPLQLTVNFETTDQDDFYLVVTCEYNIINVIDTNGLWIQSNSY